MYLFFSLKKLKYVSVLFSIFIFTQLHSQSLIINEISNGPNGNKEYIELVVIDTAAFYNCGNTTPPCIDIRGWIIDDNSGYHGSGGVATGANRFSQNALWSCVPLGTIILIYNDADFNTEIPANDISLSDGNCRIIAPISNSSLFQTNVTTPGAFACSYPATGWISGGDWNAILLANTGDCARIVDLNGCEVFSLCWATPNNNTLIYFNSGSSGTDNVWFFNGGNPNLQINWSEGCADASTCGTDNQTPGSPNNLTNQNYIAQFNNNCAPITPLIATASSLDNTCACNGEVSVSATGSIPGYTYEWYDSNFSNLLGSGNSLSGLCEGNYHVIVTSSIDCLDTAHVEVILNLQDCNDTTIFVSDSHFIYIPNIFSPNGDSYNDLFSISGYGIENFHLTIFNRWGQELFISESMNQSWNGEFKNKEVPEGTYYYLIRVIYSNAMMDSFNGSFTLKRE